MAGPGTGHAPTPRGESATTAGRSSIDSVPNAIPDDPPPAYSDDEDHAQPQGQVQHPTRIIPSTGDEEVFNWRMVAEGKTLSTYRNRTTYTVTLHDEYSKNPDLLYELIRSQAKLPPVPFIHIRGSHIEKNYNNTTRRNSNESSSSSSTTVVDFDFLVDTSGIVLPTLSDAMQNHEQLERDKFWNLNIVQDNDDQRAYRGGRVKTRDRKQRRRRNRDQEQLLGETTLEDWCFRYCSNKAKVKS